MKAHRASPLLSALIASLFIRSFSHHVIRSPEPLGCFYFFLFFLLPPPEPRRGRAGLDGFVLGTCAESSLLRDDMDPAYRC